MTEIATAATLILIVVSKSKTSVDAGKKALTALAYKLAFLLDKCASMTQTRLLLTMALRTEPAVPPLKEILAVMDVVAICRKFISLVISATLSSTKQSRKAMLPRDLGVSHSPILPRAVLFKVLAARLPLCSAWKSVLLAASRPSRPVIVEEIEAVGYDVGYDAG